MSWSFEIYRVFIKFSYVEHYKVTLYSVIGSLITLITGVLAWLHFLKKKKKIYSVHNKFHSSIKFLDICYQNISPSLFTRCGLLKV